MNFSFLIPQEKKFFDLLEQYADLARQITSLLLDFFKNIESRETQWREIKFIEEKGDDLQHTIVDELNSTFVTPIDREDIHKLASQLDDILDYAEGAAERVVLFKIGKVPSQLLELAEILYQCAKELSSAIPILRNISKWQDLKKHYVEIHRLENRGDALLRAALVELFETKDAVEILKLKEIIEFVEEAIDKNEDVAVTIENLVVKHV
jgi:uncharacterized protein